VLEGLERGRYDDRVYRLAGGWTVRKAAKRRGLSEEDLEEVLARIGGEVPDFLDAPFTVFEESLDGVGRYGARTRFSDGTFPVFYASTTAQTSQREVKHHCEQEAVEHPERRSIPKKFCVLRCNLNAAVVDLRPSHATDGKWASLTSSNTADPTCLAIGREAAAANDFEALLAPSARDRGGTTTPTFKRSPLSNAVVERWVRFTFDPASGRASDVAA
jgi:hypothetical protein